LTSPDKTAGIIDTIKAELGIDKPNEEMTDDEIQQTLRYVGDRAPDTEWGDGKPILGRIGIEVMIFLAIMEFPWWYERWNLSQWN